MDYCEAVNDYSQGSCELEWFEDHHLQDHDCLLILTHSQGSCEWFDNVHDL